MSIYKGAAAHTYDSRRFVTASGRAIHAIEMRHFVDALTLVPRSASVLEVGCGTGRFLAEAAQRGMHCTGVDGSPDMLQLAREKLGATGRASFEQAEAAKLPFSDGTFDFVYSIRVLNQMESVDYALSSLGEWFRVTRDDGRLLIEFVNRWRPSLHRAGVQLSPSRVIKTVRSHGGQVVWLRGAFFFGMTAQHRVPESALPFLNWLDRLLSRLLPRLCARCYLLVQK